MSLTNSSFFDIVYFVDPNTYLDRTVEVWKKSPLRYGLLTARDTAFFLIDFPGYDFGFDFTTMSRRLTRTRSRRG